ncbi:MAG TPA: hypothetical protein VK982_13245 [Bacteroidales bacterium]|nr:hypothetical protein [Bacteroidales bacterium]
MIKQLDLYKTGKSQWTTGNETLADIINIYAPPSDNNPTENYINFVANRLNIDKNTPISEIDSNALAKAMIAFESPKQYKQLYE